MHVEWLFHSFLDFISCMLPLFLFCTDTFIGSITRNRMDYMELRIGPRWKYSKSFSGIQAKLFIAWRPHSWR